MESQDFEESNLLLKAGDNPNTNDLKAARCIDPNTNMPFIVAKFKLSKEELEKIIETGDIWVCIMGNSWPPILPTVHHPFKDHGFDTEPRGLPITMKYREETEEMLRDCIFEDLMSEEYWAELLVEVSRRFDFVKFGNSLETGVKNGHSINDMLIQYRSLMTKIFQKDQLRNNQNGN